MIVPPQDIEEVGEETFDMHPVGAGPFQVVEYTPTAGLLLERFDGCWSGSYWVVGCLSPLVFSQQRVRFCLVR